MVSSLFSPLGHSKGKWLKDPLTSQGKAASKLVFKQVTVLQERSGRQWGISSGLLGVQVFEFPLLLSSLADIGGLESRAAKGTSELGAGSGCSLEKGHHTGILIDYLLIYFRWGSP